MDLFCGYGFFKAFEQLSTKVDLALAGIGRIEAWDTAERAAMVAQIKALIDAATIAQEEKDKLNAEITKAFVKSETAESRLRSAIPT